MHRSAQFNPALNYADPELDLFSEEDKKVAEGKTESPLAQRGFVHVPATWTTNEKVPQYRDGRPNPDRRIPGGVIARGAIERAITVNLVALRRLGGENAQGLRRYILGLALVAATKPLDGFLRQGCLLVQDEKAPAEWVAVACDGARTPVALSPATAFDYAKVAASKFVVGADRPVVFKKEWAQADLKELEGKKGKKTKNAA
jgi:CRISPR-associated protein Csb1